MTICLVTDRRQLTPGARTTQDEVTALSRWLEEAVMAGVDLIQIRERDLPARVLGELASTVRTVAAGSKTRVVVNDRVDVALASGSDGVHLRGDGPPVDRVRELAGTVASALRNRPSYVPPYVARREYVARPVPQGRDLLIGRSVHSVGEARMHASADYLLFGAVYQSGGKPGLGLGALRAAASAFAGPVVAIGGVSVIRAAECMEAGAAGVAAIRLFLPPGRADDGIGVAEAVARLRAVFDPATTRHLQ